MTPPSNTPFTAVYAQWLESFRAMIPGCAKPDAAVPMSPKQEQAAANEEWEDEGGSLKP